MKDTDEPSICTDKTNAFLSEYTSIWWLWKHYAEIGNPEYIAFLHYRRFFTTAKPNSLNIPVIFVKDDLQASAIKKIIPDNRMLMKIVNAHNADGILPARFPDCCSYVARCTDVVDLMHEESNELKLGFDKNMCMMMFDLLASSMKKHFDEQYVKLAFKFISTYHFNVFLLKSALFALYNEILEETVFKSIEMLENMNAMS